MSTKAVPESTVTKLDVPSRARVGALTQAPNGRIYAAAGAEVLLSDDDGRTFRACASVPGSQPLFGAHVEGDLLYVVGGNGAISRSDDGGVSFVRLRTEPGRMLFRIRRGPDGALWACGDGERLLRSTDGVSFELPEGRSEAAGRERYLDVAFEGGNPLVLGSSGRIRRVRGAEEQVLPLFANKAGRALPLTRLLVLDGGAWLVLGDGGAVFRSDDRGQTFQRVPLPVACDVEDGVVTSRGVILVGSGGAVLYSSDQGRSFSRIASDLDAHLWSVLGLEHGVVLLAGEGGLLARLELSATETLGVPAEADATADILGAEPDAAEQEDEDGDEAAEEEDEHEDEDEGGEEPVATTFASVEEASARWRKEGRAFIDALNAYVRRCYEVGPNKAGHEPKETREDMADYVRSELVRLNAAGEHRRARELFPPAYEPFDYEQLGARVDAVAFLDDERRLVAARGGVFVLTRDRIEQVEGLDTFGRSPDGRFFAKVQGERIDVHEGWDGPRVRSLPRGGLASIAQLVLTPAGDAAAVAGDGIHFVHEGGVDELAGDASFSHVALSPNGRFLAYGTQDTSHVLLDRKTGLEHRFEPVSSYPHFAFFHPDAPMAVFSSCHALYGSGSLVVDLERLVSGRPEHASLLDRRAWVHSGAGAGDLLLLGDRSGYVWARRPGDDGAAWYLFLGSTLTAMDLSRDGKKLLVGSQAGYVVELDLGAPEPDPSLLTNGPVLETARWVFWAGHPPLVW